MAALEKEQTRLLAREKTKKLTRADVIAELGEMLVATSDKPGRSGWSARLKVLQVLAQVLNGREAAQPSDAVYPKPVPDDQLHQRIALLKEQLKAPEEHSDHVPETPEHHPKAISAPQPECEARATSTVINPALVPQSEHERLQECGRHGSYLSVRVRGSWSNCGKCVAEWESNEKWLRNLMPAGPGK